MDPVVERRAGDAEAGAEIFQILSGGELRVERKFLRDVAHLGPCGAPCRSQIGAGHGNRSARWRQKPAEHAECCGLAGPVGAEESEDLAFFNGKARVLNGRKAPEAAGDASGNNRLRFLNRIGGRKYPE